MMRSLWPFHVQTDDPYQEHLAARGLLVELEGPRVRLRTVRLADAPRLGALLEDAEVSRFFTWTPPRDREETEEYLRGFQLEILHQTAYHFTILSRPEDEPIGVCNLYHIDRERAQAEVGIWLGRAYWGRGLQADVNRLLIRHAMQELGFRRVLFRVAEANHRARRAFEGLGARPIGRTALYCQRLQHTIAHVVYALDEPPREEESRER
jgi:RimJ/RimL family protein N-acetyltransferase